MKPARDVPPQTVERQARAADPGLSAWVAANAGSGKTFVLVNRVLRLLLTGVEPGRLLCITYTKAAAANMANRLFTALSGWAVMPDEELAAALARLRGAPADGEAVATARRLFARALETPGGLRIETIHAFCTRVLQATPFEANVPPRFAIADEQAQAQMMLAARRELIAEAGRKPQGEAAWALDRLAREAALESFDAIMQEALARRALFSDEEGRARDARRLDAELSRFLGIAPERTAAEVNADFLSALRANAGRDALLAAFDAGTKMRQNAALAIRQALLEDCVDPVSTCRRGLLTEALTVTAHVRGKDKSALPPDLDAALDAVAGALCKAIDELSAIAIRDRNRALGLAVTRILASYRRQKSRRGELDYDDLIARTRSLLTRLDAAWVHYKLDAGIDHILLDEAQDTSEPQWSILGSLSSDFFAGLGVRNGRTVFVVGDEKQSIYGFQGAAPSAFDEERRKLERRVAEAGERFEPIALNTSFRSTPEVMAAVDAVFGRPEHARGLVFGGAERPEIHDTVRRSEHGAVDLWPVCRDEERELPEAWTTPVDAPERRSAIATLAGRIADTLAGWMQDGRDDLGRPFSPGDVMILVRNRGALFEAIVRALKDRRVDVAGRDRLTLASHAAVEDLIVLGRAILLPEDDLTLATALKTPLFSLTDDDLLIFAPQRAGSLHAALAGADHPRLVAAKARFDELRREAARCGPFRFFARLLGPEGGRSLAMARLGEEAGDALDAFLSAALDHERRHGPSLCGFINHIAHAATDVKRDLSAKGSQVRVMTVHGAKGLEAPIVILADLGLPPNGRNVDRILGIDGRDGLIPLWLPGQEEDCQASRRARETALARLEEEHHRLLYVAMTRAEDRLIVCGVSNRDVPPGSWYGMVESGLALSSTGLAEIAGPFGEPIRRFALSAPGPVAADVPPMPIRTDAVLPAWVTAPVPREAPDLPPLQPSGIARAADRPDRVVDDALATAARAGKLAHLLLQLLPGLPEAERAQAGGRLCKLRASELDEGRCRSVLDDVLKLIGDPEHAALFGPQAMAEVDIAGEIVLGDGSVRPVSGRIDRLAVTADEVIVADFKTTSRPPRRIDDLPEASLAQIAAYRALLRGIYPGHRIRAMLIYTDGGHVFEPPAQTLDAALARRGSAAHAAGGAGP